MRFNKRHRETCFYCGVYGNHKDHINPKSYSGKDWFLGVEYVYACNECNATLNNKILDLPNRILFLIEKYTFKYRLETAAIAWDEDEVGELGPSLRKRIKRGLAIRRRAEERVIYLRYLLNKDEE